MKGAAKRMAGTRSHERFLIQVTSNFFREADSLPPSRDVASTALILLFREEVFSRRHAAEGPRSTIAAAAPARMRWKRANILASGFNPLSRLHPRMSSGIGPGKSYPVTAAQLLPNLTGIPRTAPQPQLTKNCRQK